MIPKINEGEVVWAEHYARYIFSSFFIKGKVVLDLGCGVGKSEQVVSRYQELLQKQYNRQL